MPKKVSPVINGLQKQVEVGPDKVKKGLAALKK
jgi:hypothetical protein